ncbi:MAG: hypothetical protein K6G31_06965 [Paludibacteraceae bacterium]|nr:hypothetical protein [Paludibacteraceae bacterium]
MLDLKTGRFVIDAGKGWELHPFMSRQEFFDSGLFKSAFPDINEIKTDKRSYHLGIVSINGYEMYTKIVLGGLHDCVEKIRLISTELSEIQDINNMPSNWKEIAYETKRIHDEFLQKEMSVALHGAGDEKDKSFMLPWGGVRSDFCLRYDIPSAEIVINYFNITDDDRKELKDIPLW